MLHGAAAIAVTAKYREQRRQLGVALAADLKTLEADRKSKIRVIEDAHKQAVNDRRGEYELEMVETFDNEREEKGGPGTESGQQ